VSCFEKGTALQAAEKGLLASKLPEEQTAGAEAQIDFAAVTARLKSCPDTKPAEILAGTSFSAACIAHANFAALAARLKSCPVTKPLLFRAGSSFPGASLA
jgi:hypothetical protein